MLLSKLGCSFRVEPVQVNENPLQGEVPADYVQRMAREKAHQFKALTEDTFVLAADTIVVDEEKILGKPASPLVAMEMLKQLKGKDHKVISALVLMRLSDRKEASRLCWTTVTMRDYTEAEIESYIASGDPFDKAGAYAIQHSGFRPVLKIEGCFTNVVGLPICHLVQLFEESGIMYHNLQKASCVDRRFDRPGQVYVCSFTTENL
jgi:septum formation protein